MAERMGANGLPMKKKIVTVDDVQETETLQEILEVNPNTVEEVEEEILEELEVEEEDEEEEEE